MEGKGYGDTNLLNVGGEKQVIRRVFQILGWGGFSLFLCASVTFSQEKPHGDFLEERKGVHSGNKVRTTFFNSGWLGRASMTEDYGGEWPINSGHEYIGDVIILVGGEFKDIYGELKHSVVTARGPQVGARTGEKNKEGTEWWTWEALPGYANPDSNIVAMSHIAASWPPFWPDKMDDAVDPGWPGSWNGYFGKNVFNADQESYYVMDDYNDREFMFYPDTTDTTRRGLGLQVRVRGLQWSQVLAEDVIFWLHDITNIGTYNHDKMVFGMIVGTITGGDGDTEDDCADFIKEDNITYSYDWDGIGAGGWSPVGYAGYAFLESPGNPFDGIDNDGDGMDGPGPIISTDMFKARTLHAGDQIVLIDYTTYERTVTTMPSDSLVFYYRDKRISLKPGDIVSEIPGNNIDDDLNGLIDESNGSEFEIAPGVTQKTYLYVGLKYKNWLTGEGLDNLLIDERRDDGIDNDGDWDPLTDDVGLDGAMDTGDPGEGDGQPSSGVGTDLPGEPHIDKTDVTESDQIGLTSFYFFHPFDKIPLYDDDKLWDAMTPGFFNATEQNVDGDFIYGSGYFPLPAGTTERFSMALVFGEDRNDIIRNKRTVQTIYDENYNFAKAPLLPTLRAVAGDGEVILYWDDIAEQSYDFLTGYDFEGYKIYRASDPGWEDAGAITDAFGTRKFDKPIAQFDLKNGIKGFFPIGFDGIQFYLGDDTGLQHTFRDTTVINGHRYFYAVTAYDRGDPERGILPSETAKYATIDQAGNIETGKNVVAVVPEAPAAGYVPPGIDIQLVAGSTTGKVRYRIIDPREIRDRHTYRITFEDTLIKARVATEMDTLTTKNFTLVDVTDPDYPDTLLFRCTLLGPEDELPVIHGFQLSFVNERYVALNTKLSKWSRSGIHPFEFRPFRYRFLVGTPKPSDYRITFGDVGIDTSKSLKLSRRLILPAKPVNFRVTNVSEGKDIDFAFWELSGDDGVFSADSMETDIIIFLEDFGGKTSVVTWSFRLIYNRDRENPQPGDAAEIWVRKPFLSSDVFEFTTQAARIDTQLARARLDRIRVVPNPYIVAATWEPRNPFTSGRGPRELHFINLPPRATIRIYTVQGELVDVIEHNSPIDNGTAVWDMLTKDNLDIAYGVYIYHVDAPGIGQKVGKFAVIK